MGKCLELVPVKAVSVVELVRGNHHYKTASSVVAGTSLGRPTDRPVDKYCLALRMDDRTEPSALLGTVLGTIADCLMGKFRHRHRHLVVEELVYRHLCKTEPSASLGKVLGTTADCRVGSFQVDLAVPVMEPEPVMDLVADSLVREDSVEVRMKRLRHKYCKKSLLHQPHLSQRSSFDRR